MRRPGIFQRWPIPAGTHGDRASSCTLKGAQEPSYSKDQVLSHHGPIMFALTLFVELAKLLLWKTTSDPKDVAPGSCAIAGSFCELGDVLMANPSASVTVPSAVTRAP